MLLLALFLAALAALIHYYIFWLESVAFEGPGRKVFGITREEAAALKQVFYNQGFYNLFLAIGALGGLIWGGDKGHAIALFACACMAGAGVVLIASDRRMVRAAAAQAVPPIVALVLAAVL